MERAIYRELLDFSWVNGPLENDPKQLALTIACPEKEFIQAWARVQHKFVQDNQGRLINRRLEEHRSEQESRYNSKYENAQATNRKRRQKTNGAHLHEDDQQPLTKFGKQTERLKDWYESESDEEPPI